MKSSWAKIVTLKIQVELYSWSKQKMNFIQKNYFGSNKCGTKQFWFQKLLAQKRFGYG